MGKVLEIESFQALGSFETLGSKLSHGTSWIAEIIHWIISPNVRTHLRKIVNRKTKLDENLALFFLLTVNGLFFFIQSEAFAENFMGFRNGDKGEWINTIDDVFHLFHLIP